LANIMNFKIRYFFVISILYSSLLISCRIQSITKIPFQTKYHQQLKTIGIYVSPSDYHYFDDLVLNNLKLYFLSLGYEPVNVFSQIREPGLIDKIMIGGNHQKTVQYFVNKIDLKNISTDALVIATSKWNYNPFLNSSKIYQPSGSLWFLKLSLSIIDNRTKNVILAGKDSEGTYIFTRENNLTEEDKTSEKQTGYQLPVRKLIQKNISKIFASLPPSKYEFQYKVGYHFPVIFAADQVYRKYYGRYWRTMLQRRLLFVNDIFSRQFGIEFFTKKFIAWNTSSQDSLQLLNKEIQKDIKMEKRNIIIGITHDNNLIRNWKKLNVIGISNPMLGYIVMKDIPAFHDINSWDSIDEALILVHELGHLFGAAHILNPNSVLFPSNLSMSYKFDEFNTRVINLTKNYLFKINSRKIFWNYIDGLINLYLASNDKNLFFLPILSSLIEDYPEYSSIKNLNLHVSNRSVYYGVLGYKNLHEGHLIDAKKDFVKAIKFNPGFSESYFLLGKVYQKLKENSKAEKYFDIARQKGFDVTDPY